MPNKIAEGSWIKVKGVPFNLWDKGIFDCLGYKFRALLEIHTSTLSWTDVSAVRIKVQSFEVQENIMLFSFNGHTFPTQVKPMKLVNGETDLSFKRIRVSISSSSMETRIPESSSSIPTSENIFQIGWPSIQQSISISQISRQKTNVEKITRVDLAKKVSFDFSKSNLISNLPVEPKRKTQCIQVVDKGPQFQIILYY